MQAYIGYLPPLINRGNLLSQFSGIVLLCVIISHWEKP